MLHKRGQGGTSVWRLPSVWWLKPGKENVVWNLFHSRAHSGEVIVLQESRDQNDRTLIQVVIKIGSGLLE
jgi:hypothetical protein